MVMGNSQLKRYFTSAAVAPLTCSGQTSTSRAWWLRSPQTNMAPLTLPQPDPLDQMMFGSVGSGVANPLSPPATGCHSEREMPPPKGPKPPPTVLLGPRYDEPSCLLP